MKKPQGISLVFHGKGMLKEAYKEHIYKVNILKDPIHRNSFCYSWKGNAHRSSPRFPLGNTSRIQVRIENPQLPWGCLIAMNTDKEIN